MSREILSLWEHLPSAIVSPSTLTTPPASRHRKRLSAFCELSGKYLSWEQGVIMPSERSNKKKVEKKKSGEGEIMTKAPHCSSSSTPELVVHRLACASCGWGCPPLGPVWKQIYQVSSRQKWMRTISQLSIVNMNEASLPENFPFFQKGQKKNELSISFSTEKCSGLVMLGILAQKKTLTAVSDERDLLPSVEAVEGKRKFDSIFRFLPHPVPFSFSFLLPFLTQQVLPQSTATTAAAAAPMTNHNVAGPVGLCVTFPAWP